MSCHGVESVRNYQTPGHDQPARMHGVCALPPFKACRSDVADVAFGCTADQNYILVLPMQPPTLAKVYPGGFAITHGNCSADVFMCAMGGQCIAMRWGAVHRMTSSWAYGWASSLRHDRLSIWSCVALTQCISLHSQGGNTSLTSELVTGPADLSNGSPRCMVCAISNSTRFLVSTYNLLQTRPAQPYQTSALVDYGHRTVRDCARKCRRLGNYPDTS